MPRRTWSWVVRPITTILMTMVLAVAGITAASPASAAEPIAPTQFDRCGTEQDQYVIPPLNGGNAYYVNGVYQLPATYTVPAGTTSVTITSDGMVNREWTFDYVNNGACGPEATNAMAVDVQPCNTFTGLTEVLITYTNVADGTGWYNSDVYAEAYLKERGFITGSAVMDDQLLDGQSRTFDLGSPSSMNDPVGGMTPGTYVFSVRHSRGGLTTFERRIEACGGTYTFPGEPPLEPTDPGEALSGKATARIVPGKFVTHRVLMDARKVKGKGTVRFRVQRKFAGKTRVIKRARIDAGSKKSYRVRAQRGSTLIVSVRKPDSRSWVRVAKKRIKR